MDPGCFDACTVRTRDGAFPQKKKKVPPGEKKVLGDPLNEEGGENEPTSEWASIDIAWKCMEGQEDGSHVIMDNVLIAVDGGLSEIGIKEDLWYSSRYFSAFILIIFVIYNVYFIFSTGLKAISGPVAKYPQFLVSETILNMTGLTTGHHSPEKIVYVLEVAILCGLLAVCAYRLCLFKCCTGCRKWDALAYLCWFTLPNISSYSAIKLLQYVTPQQLSYNINYILWYEPKRTKMLRFAQLLITTPIALIVGLDCFLIKVRNANQFIKAEEASWENVMGTIILLNQILGVVQITKTIKDRLYRFVFAGEDGMMTVTERCRRTVWDAMVAQKIVDRYSAPQAIAMLLTWCDDDFQMLCLNKVDGKVQIRTRK